MARHGSRGTRSAARARARSPRVLYDEKHEHEERDLTYEAAADGRASERQRPPRQPVRHDSWRPGVLDGGREDGRGDGRDDWRDARRGQGLDAGRDAADGFTPVRSRRQRARERQVHARHDDDADDEYTRAVRHARGGYNMRTRDRWRDGRDGRDGHEGHEGRRSRRTQSNRYDGFGDSHHHTGGHSSDYPSHAPNDFSAPHINPAFLGDPYAQPSHWNYPSSSTMDAAPRHPPPHLDVYAEDYMTGYDSSGGHTSRALGALAELHVADSDEGEEIIDRWGNKTGYLPRPRWQRNNSFGSNSPQLDGHTPFGTQQRAYGHKSPRSHDTRGAPSRPPDRSPRSPTSMSYAERQAAADPFVLVPPAPEYIEMSRATLGLERSPVPKLVVLDLNGALVYRTARTGPNRHAYPRPYLANFLQYLFMPDPDGPRPYDVLVWSSAQPHNVRNMVETTFGLRFCEGIWEAEQSNERRARIKRDEGRLIGVWARDRMNLPTGDYNRKVQTVKDLRKVTAEFDAFDERRVILIDDSPLKAMHQPWSQLIIPEYEKEAFMAARSAASELDVNGAGVDPQAAPGMDDILLAVVGILEAMRYVANVPAWVRAGHIQAPRAAPVDFDRDAEVTLDVLPSHESFVPWFNDPDTHAYWVSRGREALLRKGIKVAHGLDLNGARAGSRSPVNVHAQQRNSHRRWRSRESSPQPHTDGRYSPSSPAT